MTAAATIVRPPQRSAPTNDERMQLDALTSLRVVASAAIVLEHAVATFHLPRSIELWNTTAALSFFFVMSGFILSYTHPNFRGKSELVKYCKARFARLWPLHIATMLIFAFVIKNGAGFDDNGNPRLDVLLAQIFFVQAWTWNPSFFFSFNTPAWSISADIFFYLCFPLIQRFRQTHVMIRSASLVAFTAAIAAGCTAIGAHSSDPVFKTWVTYINPLSHLFEFTIGIFCCGLFNHLKNFNTPKVATALQMAAVLLGIYYFSHCSELSYALRYFPIQTSYGLYCALLVLAFSLSRGFLARMISNKVLVKLGDMTYSIYLLHSLISSAFRPQWEYFAITKGRISFIIYVIVVLIASYICHEFFEDPLRKFLIGKRKLTDEKSVVAIILQCSFDQRPL